MTGAEADRIIETLAAAYPIAPAAEGTNDLWRRNLIPLHYEVADRAAALCITDLDYHPTVATFLQFYRSERGTSPQESRDASDRRAAELAGIQLPAPEIGAERSKGVPEWVSVWWWQLTRTQGERRKRAAAASGRKPEHCSPVRMRDFPQLENPGADALTQNEYEKVRAAWVKAGSPNIDSVSELFEGSA